MAFLAKSGGDFFFYQAFYVGGDANQKDWVYVTPDSLTTVITPGYVDDSEAISKVSIGDYIRVYQCSNRRDLSTQTRLFKVKVIDKTTTALTLEVDSIGNGEIDDDIMPLYSTRAIAAAADIPLTRTTVMLGGLNAAGDGHGAIYKQVASLPTHDNGWFLSANGKYYDLALPSEYETFPIEYFLRRNTSHATAIAEWLAAAFNEGGNCFKLDGQGIPLLVSSPLLVRPPTVGADAFGMVISNLNLGLAQGAYTWQSLDYLFSIGGTSGGDTYRWLILENPHFDINNKDVIGCHVTGYDDVIIDRPRTKGMPSGAIGIAATKYINSTGIGVGGGVLGGGHGLTIIEPDISDTSGNADTTSIGVYSEVGDMVVQGGKLTTVGTGVKCYGGLNIRGVHFSMGVDGNGYRRCAILSLDPTNLQVLDCEIDKSYILIDAAVDKEGTVGSEGSTFSRLSFDHLEFSTGSETMPPAFPHFINFRGRKINTVMSTDTVKIRADWNTGGGSSKFFGCINSAVVTNITQANPGVVTTSTAHGFTTGQTAFFESVTGMTIPDPSISERITNGNFSSFTGWSGTNWSRVSNKAQHAAGSTANLVSTISVTAGFVYTLVFTVSGRTVGDVTPKLLNGSTVTGTTRSTNADFTESLTAVTGNTQIGFTPSSDFDGSIDDVSLLVVPGIVITVSDATHFSIIDTTTLGAYTSGGIVTVPATPTIAAPGSWDATSTSGLRVESGGGNVPTLPGLMRANIVKVDGGHIAFNPNRVEGPALEVAADSGSNKPIAVEFEGSRTSDGSSYGDIVFGNRAGAAVTVLTGKARVRAYRDGADNSTKVALTTMNAGVEADALTMSATGTATVAGGVTLAGFLTASSGGSLTIAAGVVTAIATTHSIDTEAAAAADDLDTINGGSGGSWLTLQSVNSGRDVTVKNGTGNIVLPGGDFILNTTDARITLRKSGSSWVEVSRSSAPASTYTPTFTGVTNVDSVSGTDAIFMRSGNVVTVGGRLTLDITAAAATEVGISLPITSNLGNVQDCVGTAFCTAIQQGGSIIADSTNDRASLQFLANDVGNRGWSYMFTYRII